MSASRKSSSTSIRTAGTSRSASRPWERNAFRTLARDPNVGRSYKVIRIGDANGRVESLKDRLMAPAR